MTNLDYEAIIALSEDPDVTFEDVPGRPPTPEELKRVAKVADAIFCQSSLETQISVTRSWPANVSARKLALLPDHQREELLSHLPLGLAKEIISLLRVTAG